MYALQYAVTLFYPFNPGKVVGFSFMHDFEDIRSNVMCSGRPLCPRAPDPVFWIEDINGTSDTKSIITKMKPLKLSKIFIQ